MPEAVAPHATVELDDVDVSGRLHGNELSGSWRFLLSGETLQLSRGEQRLEVPASSLSGLELRPGSLELSFTEGGALSVSGSDRLHEMASALDQVEFQVGEMLRASSRLGSRRARPGRDHDTFFAPFLAARRALASSDMASPVERLDLDAVRMLRSAVVEALQTIAFSHFPDQAADRRALVAELDDCTVALFDALDRLENAAERVRAAPPGGRYVAWREWKRALAEAFSRAESSWMTTIPALDAARERDSGPRDLTVRPDGE